MADNKITLGNKVVITCIHRNVSNGMLNNLLVVWPPTIISKLVAYQKKFKMAILEYSSPEEATLLRK